MRKPTALRGGPPTGQEEQQGHEEVVHGEDLRAEAGEGARRGAGGRK